MTIKKVSIANNHFYLRKFGDSVKEVWVVRDRKSDKVQEEKKRNWAISLGCEDNMITKIENTWVFTDEKFAALFYLKFNKR